MHNWSDSERAERQSNRKSPAIARGFSFVRIRLPLSGRAVVARFADTRKRRSHAHGQGMGLPMALS